MNMKKFALKGILILAVVVALCMFFSGTIKTLTTAKVKLVTPRSGKLEEKISLSGVLTFPETQELFMETNGSNAVTITNVNTRAGYTMKQGDVLLEAEISGYDSTMAGYENSYNTAMMSLMELEKLLLPVLVLVIYQ